MLSNNEIKDRIDVLRARIPEMGDRPEQLAVLEAGLDLLQNFLQNMNDIAYILESRRP